MSPPTRSLAGGASPMTRSIGREKKWRGVRGTSRGEEVTCQTRAREEEVAHQGCAWE
jgi:hypothetical protein